MTTGPEDDGTVAESPAPVQAPVSAGVCLECGKVHMTDAELQDAIEREGRFAQEIRDMYE